MKILILGASGRTGLHLVREAIERGHEVVALVRDPEKLEISDKDLEIIEGSPLNYDDLDRATDGVDVVVGALNINRKREWPWSRVVSPTDLLSESMKLVVDVMEKKSIRRLVVITAAGCGETREKIPAWFNYIVDNSNIGVTYKDHNRQEEIIQATNLEWTLVRPVGLTNRDRDKEVQAGPEAKHTSQISRQNVAKFILDAIEQGKYIGNGPVISER